MWRSRWRWIWLGANGLCRAVEKAGVVAVSGMTERFDPGIREAKRRIDAGEIGEVIAIRALHQHGRLSFHPRDWWNDPEQGGPELSLMWYAADVCRWLAGSEVARVYAEYDTFNSPGSPFMDNGKATFRFANGTLGSADIYFSCDFEFPHWEVEVMGTTGAIRTQQSAYSVTTFRPDGPRVSVAPSHDMLRDEVANWIAACRGEGEAFMSIQDARAVMSVCFLVCEFIHVAEFGVFHRSVVNHWRALDDIYDFKSHVLKLLNKQSVKNDFTCVVREVEHTVSFFRKLIRFIYIINNEVFGGFAQNGG